VALGHGFYLEEKKFQQREGVIMSIDIRALGYFNDLAKLGMPVGTQKSIAINVSSQNQVITTPIRQITATAGSVIYVDITTNGGVDSNVPIPPNMPCLNITMVYKEGTDCINMRGWPVD
jgi:hypothetical protein